MKLNLPRYFGTECFCLASAGAVWFSSSAFRSQMVKPPESKTLALASFGAFILFCSQAIESKFGKSLEMYGSTRNYKFVNGQYIPNAAFDEGDPRVLAAKTQAQLIAFGILGLGAYYLGSHFGLGKLDNRNVTLGVLGLRSIFGVYRAVQSCSKHWIATGSNKSFGTLLSEFMQGRIYQYIQ